MSESTELAKEVLQRIDIYAEKLGIVGSSIYEVIVAQQVIDAWIAIGMVIGSYVIVAIIVGIGCIANKRRIYYGILYKESDKYQDREAKGFYEGMSIVALILFFITMGLATIHSIFVLMPNIIGKLSNPQYYAIQEMRKLF